MNLDVVSYDSTVVYTQLSLHQSENLTLSLHTHSHHSSSDLGLRWQQCNDYSGQPVTGRLLDHPLAVVFSLPLTELLKKLSLSPQVSVHEISPLNLLKWWTPATLVGCSFHKSTWSWTDSDLAEVGDKFPRANWSSFVCEVQPCLARHQRLHLHCRSLWSIPNCC